MKNKTRNMLVALSAFQVAGASMAPEAHAMSIRSGHVNIGHNGVSCSLDHFLVSKAIKDINGNKYTKNVKVTDTDTVAMILKKLNHQFTDMNTVLSKGLNAPGYYDEYPHKLPNYFANNTCQVGGR